MLTFLFVHKFILSVVGHSWMQGTLKELDNVWTKLLVSNRRWNSLYSNYWLKFY